MHICTQKRCAMHAVQREGQYRVWGRVEISLGGGGGGRVEISLGGVGGVFLDGGGEFLVGRGTGVALTFGERSEPNATAAAAAPPVSTQRGVSLRGAAPHGTLHP